MPVIDTLIFDLGNVLINFNHHRAAQRIAPFAKKHPDEIYRLFFDSVITREFEEGKILPEEFFSAVKGVLGSSISFEEFLPIWNEIFFLTPENEQVLALVRALKPHYKIALLSNINVLHYQYLKKNFPIFDPFHAIFTSFELGYVKPATQAYQKVLTAMGSAPAGTFYTDDRAELIESSLRLGIRGFVFKGAAQLKEDLISAGVMVSSVESA